MALHILKVSRLEGLTDGIFAIAMTILVLNLEPPNISLTVAGIGALLTPHLYEQLFVYVGSFIILGTLWVAMSFQIGLLERINRPYMWAHIFYLMGICIVPFSASILVAYPKEHSSIFFYACNLLFTSFMQIWIAETSHFFQLNNEKATKVVRHAIIRRVALGPICYLSAIFLSHYHIKLAFILLILPTIIYMVPGKVDKYD